jgi:flavin reductase (DIM6/NTAB) family NADH-FMN oxidoreductase RutF
MTEKKDFSDIFSSVRCGVYIVTTAYRRKLAGCTAVWVSRISFEPPMLAVSLAPSRHTMQVIEQSKRLCVNVLGEAGLELAKLFGFTSGISKNKFEGVSYSISAAGSPILATAVSYFDCKVLEIVTAGDHRLNLCEVLDAAVVREEPALLYNAAEFYSAEPVLPPKEGERALG